jgi:hypothetical protein
MKWKATCLDLGAFRPTLAAIKVTQKMIGTTTEPAELLPLGTKGNIAASPCVILSGFIIDPMTSIIFLLSKGALCRSLQADVHQVRLASAESCLAAAIVEGDAR